MGLLVIFDALSETHMRRWMVSRGSYGSLTNSSCSATESKLNADPVEHVLVSLFMVVNALLCFIHRWMMRETNSVPSSFSC